MCEVASRRYCVRSRLNGSRLLGMCRQSEGGLMAGPGVLATTRAFWQIRTGTPRRDEAC